MVNMVPIADGKVGHPDLAKAWKVFAEQCRNSGRRVPRIMQAYGFAKASAGVHADGMSVDWDSTDEWYAVLWRKVTTGPAWPRLWAGNFHTHASLPNAVSAAYQVRAYRARRDGLGWRGMAGRDTLPYVAPMNLDKALARWDGRIPEDGKLGPVTVRALQRFLVKRGADMPVDGVWGKRTTYELGKYLRRNGRLPAGDLENGRVVVKAWQVWQGQYPDGWVGPKTCKAMQIWLNRDTRK